MRNVKLLLQYDGTDYAGWQVQDNATTVQGVLEEALATVLRETIRVAGASRTDSGVHALGQVAAFRTSNSLPAEKLLRALNGILPPDIRVIEITEPEADFIPRFAKEKTYRYAIACGESLSPFQRRYAWHVRDRLDFDAMREASTYFVGNHDFTSFTASGGGEKTHVREIHRVDFGVGGIITTCLEAERLADAGVYHFEIAANGFLYKMVRNIVGTLLEVGRGRIPPKGIPEIIRARDRNRAGPTAPAHGLCLVSVRY
jgi:tRNA pseudouridine38-40 synthase